MNDPVKPHIADLPLETLLHNVGEATRRAARDARRAGRTVTGIKNGEIVEYGPLLDVIAVEVKPDYRLALVFENGEKRLFDMKPYLGKGVFRQLQDPAYFALAHVANGTVSWPCEQDMAPETLYARSEPVQE